MGNSHSYSSSSSSGSEDSEDPYYHDLPFQNVTNPLLGVPPRISDREAKEKHTLNAKVMKNHRPHAPPLKVSNIKALNSFARADAPHPRANYISPNNNVKTTSGDRDATRPHHQVSVVIDEKDVGQHRLATAAARKSNAAASTTSFSESAYSQDSSLRKQPRLGVTEARDLLLAVFLPRRGQLECIESQFITLADYARMRGFWEPFLSAELRDKWYLDAVMLSVLGKDHWRSSRQLKEVHVSVSPDRDEVRRLNRQRREYSDQLRERLMDLSGALSDRDGQKNQRADLMELLNDLHRKQALLTGANSPNVTTTEDINIASDNENRGDWPPKDSNVSSALYEDSSPSTMQREELLSVSLMRLQTTVSTSFDCFDLIASRIPTSVISSLPSHYFLNSVPVVYESVAYQEKKVGDLDVRSFFVSLESRRRLLHGQPLNDLDRYVSDPRDVSPCSTVQTPSAKAKREECPIRNAHQLYTAVRHASFVVTTACSSMVLTVLFHVADVLHQRQVFAENKAKAMELGVPLSEFEYRKDAVKGSHSGKMANTVDEVKQQAVLRVISLVRLVQELVIFFRTENQAKIEKLRKRYPNVFAYLEAIATPEEKEDFDATRLLSGMVLKLMFLTGGGQRSIVADDRRVPSGVHHATDDIVLSKMLEVPILNRICWIAYMMGVPIMSSHGLLAQKNKGQPLSFLELDECSGVMRALFQAVGALPRGDACPHQFKQWFPLFPFYAVSSEGKRILMYIYTAQTSEVLRVPITVQKDMALLSFAEAFRSTKRKAVVDISNYFFEPHFIIGDEPLAEEQSALESGDASAELKMDAVEGLRVEGERWSDKAAEQSVVTPEASIGFDCKYLMPITSVGSPPNSIDKDDISSHEKDVSPTRHAAAEKSREEESRSLSSTLASETSTTCSVLMEQSLDIDVYTCVSPQVQLYIRCSSEATLQRRRVTELTPSVEAHFYHSARELQVQRPDIAPAVRRAVPKLLPSEGFLTVRWTCAVPLLTFCAGDILSAMAERVDPAPATEEKAEGLFSPLQPPNVRRNTSEVNPLSTGETTEGGASAIKSGGGGVSGGAVGNNAAAAAESLSSLRFPARTHLVTLEAEDLYDHPYMETSPEAPHDNGAVLSDVDMYPYGDAGFQAPSRKGLAGEKSSGSYGLFDRARAYQGVMNDILGVDETTRRRLGVQWCVRGVFTGRALRQRGVQFRGKTGSRRGSLEDADTSSSRVDPREVVLHVSALKMPLTIPLRILAIGHERASMSVFTFMDRNDETVCWSNPNLINTIHHCHDRDRKTGTPPHRKGEVRRNSCHALEDSMAVAASNGGPALAPLMDLVCERPLCETEEALLHLFYTMGILLGSAIINGVYLTVPIAPLAFCLMKKAISSGDHSFRSFMWLEPADGNLLSSGLVLNAAYEILTMTDHQYITFLKSRGLATPEAQIFPVRHSLAEEMQEDKAGQGSRNEEEPLLPSHSPSVKSALLNRLLSASGSSKALKFSSEAVGSPAARDRSQTGSSDLPTPRRYLELIQRHNRSGSAFCRSSCDLKGGGESEKARRSPSTTPCSFARDVKSEATTPQAETARRKSSPAFNSADQDNWELLPTRLPSRSEYIALYLVNDLAWSSVRCEGDGEKTKELWVSMARGFMTSSLAKSPLMTHCCSRVIREVLCMPEISK